MMHLIEFQDSDNGLYNYASLLESINGGKYLWSIQGFEVIMKKDCARDCDFVEKSLESPYGYNLSWSDLLSSLCKIQQIIDCIIVGSDHPVDLSEFDACEPIFPADKPIDPNETFEPGIYYFLQIVDGGLYILATDDEIFLTHFKEFFQKRKNVVIKEYY
ncbi:MAG: hypothetical protein RBU29_13480 [bacterium]|nr:hypothetical protein [bacterium]